MARQDFRLALCHIGKTIFQRARNLTVQLLPPALEHAFIGRIAYQRMFKAVDGFWHDTAAIHELCLLKLGEGMLQYDIVARDHRADHRIGELPPDSGANLGYLLH